MVKEAKELTITPKPELTSLPNRIDPMIPRQTQEVPKNLRDFISEVKFNGIRAIVLVGQGLITIRTKTNRNITEHFPELLTGFRYLAKRHEGLILDGEIIFRSGKTDQDRKIVTRRANTPSTKSAVVAPLIPCSYIAFDLLHIDGEDFAAKPLTIRKRRLNATLTKTIRDRFNITPNHFERKHHQTFVDVAKQQGFEGVVFKRKDSPYSSGKSRNWLKLKFY